MATHEGPRLLGDVLVDVLARTDAQMRKRRRFVITLAPSKGCVDPILALRASLKILSRRFGLRCISVEERP